LSGRYAKAPQKGEPPADIDVPAVAYVRMSTDHQKYSTENQLDVIRNYAAARGLTSLAIDISKASDENAQRALVEAYTEKKLRGKKLAAVLRLLQQWQRRGRHLSDVRAGRKEGYKRPLTSDALVRAYRQETDRQKLMIKKAELTQGRLLFVVEAFRLLREDEHFLTLLRAEGLEMMPSYLELSLQARPAA
jgi:ParB family transcriptional regulator, chromosome partitioning protein